MTIDAKVEVEILEKKSGAPGVLLYGLVWDKEVWDKEHTWADEGGLAKLTDNTKQLEGILKTIKKENYAFELHSGSGEYVLIMRARGSESHNHFNFNGSWEGAESGLKKQLSILRKLGYKIRYKGYRKPA